jgi:DNA-binding response OmpR family regulator
MILSSRAGDDDVEISKQVGADAYMVKPIGKKELSEKINELLGWKIAATQA